MGRPIIAFSAIAGGLLSLDRRLVLLPEGRRRQSQYGDRILTLAGYALVGMSRFFTIVCLVASVDMFLGSIACLARMLEHPSERASTMGTLWLLMTLATVFAGILALVREVLCERATRFLMRLKVMSLTPKQSLVRAAVAREPSPTRDLLRIPVEDSY